MRLLGLSPPSAVRDVPNPFRLDAVLDLFNKFVGTEERRIANEIEAKGGLKKVQQDDEALKELLGLDKSVGPQAKDGPHNMHREKTARNKISALDELKVELREDFEDALKKNFDVFTFKFELQKEYIKAESDRVIGAVKDAINQGPHMRIKNEVSTTRRICIFFTHKACRNCGRFGRTWCVPGLKEK